MSIFLHGRFLAILRAFTPSLVLPPWLCAVRPLEANSLKIRQLQMLKLLIKVKTVVYLGDPAITRMCAPRHMRPRPGIHIAQKCITLKC